MNLRKQILQAAWNMVREDWRFFHTTHNRGIVVRALGSKRLKNPARWEVIQNRELRRSRREEKLSEEYNTLIRAFTGDKPWR